MRRVRRKAGNKEKVFGCDLLEHLNASSQEIPQVLRCCSEFVETHGVVDGIYRLSGVSSNIQKLRGEFESDGSPDLNKDVYLQDIHCVSSLCKAYFRELPNPLLTYQLYDKFAEAVAIQLEEERLVKIRDVLKELPRPHYRTLEFLMRHLVHMASFSSETNMHARNLAIVWAPNLLRSKDIEASGFNGRAAFMEVRVQSIVVEFILTHVPQLFPIQGVTSERRKSLPFPTAASSPEEGVLKSASIQPPPHFGHISPGDGPLPIRPYHAIIEGTDKRKGSLKGRKWMSIFNIGGRFPDPRRRHKHSAKEKERPVLRPARSMDSLSSPSYPNEGCRRPNQRPPSTNMSAASPLVTHSPKPGSDAPAAPGALGASEYAVTYRRGTGLVSGGAGTQGTYTALDPEGLGAVGNETVQTRSPGLSTKVGRRAAMHITGPTLVTVPLHITSNLAYGVFQGGGGDRVIHRGRDKDGGDRAEVKEGGERVERKVEWGKPVEGEDKSHKGKMAEEEAVVDGGEKTAAGGGEEEKGGQGKKEEEEEKTEEVREECKWEEQLVMEGADVTREKRAKSSTPNTEEETDEDAVVDHQQVEENDEYEDMKPADFQPESTHQVFDASDVLNSTEVEGDDLGLSCYVQDNFEFLDQIDCSVMDHMDCSISNQVKEFSVEPPGHSDDEYELMEQASPRPTELHLQPEGPEVNVHSPTEPNLHRPLGIDTQSRHTKSLSLPYMTSPVHGPEGSSSEELAGGDDSDENDYSSDDDDDSYFIKSLPADFFLAGFDSVADTQDSNTLDGVPVDQLQISEEKEVATCKETTAGDQKQVEVKDKEDTDGLEEKEITEKEDEVQQRREQWENGLQSKATEEVHRDASEASTHCCTDDSLQRNDKSNSLPDITVEEEKKVIDDLHSDFPACPAVSFVTQEEIADPSSDDSADFSASEQPRSFVKGGDGDEDRKVHKETEDTRQETAVKIKENDENMWGETAEEGDEATDMTDNQDEGEIQEDGIEEDGAMCGPGDEIWDELENVICEVIQDEEREQVEKKDARKSGAGEKDDKVGEKEEQIAKVSEEEMLETDGGGTDETELRIDVEEELTVATKEKVKDAEIQQEFEEKETNLPKITKLDEALQGEKVNNDETQHHDREEVIQKDKENNHKERAFGKQRTLPSADLIRSDMKELKDGSRKCEESDSSPGGVGRKLVVSKNPRVYQVKAVPVVPPKPQHCKITALTLRQQQQERERREADRGRENLPKVPMELDRGGGGGGERQGTEEERGRKERLTPRGGERERERRRDGDENAMREKGRNSPLSMCFDEAVAIATMRREKEKECEKEKEKEKEKERQKEKEKEWGNESQ